MAHLDLLSRSLCGAAACRLTSIVPLALLDRLLSICFRYHSLVLDVSWVKVHKLDLSSATFCIHSASLCDTYYERDKRASTKLDNFFATRKSALGGDMIRPLSPYRFRRTWRRRLHTSTGSFSLEQILELSFLLREVNACPGPLVSSILPLSLLPFSPQRRLLFHLCFLILRCAYKRILTLNDVILTIYIIFTYSHENSLLFIFILRYVITRIFRHRKEYKKWKSNTKSDVKIFMNKKKSKLLN